jgi:hypothetical protein
LNIPPVLEHLASVFSRKIASPFEGGVDFDFDLIGNSGVVVCLAFPLHLHPQDTLCFFFWRVREETIKNSPGGCVKEFN